MCSLTPPSARSGDGGTALARAARHQNHVQPARPARAGLAVGVWLLQSAIRDGLGEGWSSFFLAFVLVVSLMLVASAAIGSFVGLRVSA
jgi:hypothetical protein